MSIDIENVKIRIDNYVNELGYSNDIETRFKNMYLTQLEHVVDMNKRVKRLEPFKRTFLGRTIDSTEFEYSSEDELFCKVINKINEIFNIVLKPIK